MPRKDPRLDELSVSINERIQDRTIRHMLYLEGLKTRQARLVIEKLDKEILPNLLDQLEARLSKIEKFGFDKGPATTKRLQTLIAYIEKTTAQFGTKLPKDLFKELKILTNDQLMWQIGVIRDELKFDLEFVIPPIEKVVAVVNSAPFDGFTLAQWFSNLGQVTQTRLTRAIQQGVIEGQTTSQIVKNIRGTKSLGFKDGILNTTRKQTEAIVRSAVTHVSNQARSELFKQNKDIIKGLQWNSTLDSRTCTQCMGLDQQIFDVEKGPRPPVHVSCRCAMTAVLKDANKLKQSESTRASVNGQVPKTLTYNEWLRKQDILTQEQALGKTKAKLFREGKLNVQQFTHTDGEELTLEELRRTEKNAFKKAGIDV